MTPTTTPRLTLSEIREHTRRPWRRGDQSPHWKGAAIGKDAGRDRARAAFPLRPCEDCGATPDQKKIERHHVDRNTLNNAPDNVRFLCARCHKRAHAALLTHCKNGHPFDEANTRVDREGHRECRACNRESRRRFVARRRGATP